MGLNIQQILTQDLTQFGASAMGAAAGLLSPSWSSTELPAFSSSAMSLTFAANWQSPTSGTLVYTSTGAPEVSDLTGVSLTGNVALLRIHPQAHLRIKRLYAHRFDNDANGASIRPVPLYIAIRIAAPSATGLGEVLAGGVLPPGTVTFHDNRGLIIHPLAVASAFEDLINAFPAVLPPNMAAGLMTTAAGGLDKIAKADGAVAKVFVHFVNPHGGPWIDPGAGQGLQIGASHVTAAGPTEWTAGQTITRENTGAGAMLYFGWATFGTLATAAVAKPNIPAPNYPPGSGVPTLVRDFFRVCAADLNQFLLGNRSASAVPVQGVGPADAIAPNEAQPVVRVGSNITYLPDGLAVLGALNSLLTQLNAYIMAHPGASLWPGVTAPTVQTNFALPTDNTVASRWPQAPTAAAPAAWNTATAGKIRAYDATGISAAWSGPTGPDIILTVAAGIIPSGAFVRVYPRLFVTGPSLTDAATLFRADGNSAIAPAAGAFQLTLRDPLGLNGLARPASPTLHFDLLVIPRPAGAPPRPRLMGNFVLSVGAPAAPLAAPPPVINAIQNLIPANHRAQASAPVAGLPPRPGPAFTIGSAGDLVNIVLALASEAAPREGPRFPTMARYDSIAAIRTDLPTVTFNGILSGAFIAPESHIEQYRSGNPTGPGDPAVPETHVTGVQCDGQLAYDLAIAAQRRVESLPLRLIELDDNKFNPPPAGASTMAGAALQTIAPVCETPELSLYAGDYNTLPSTWAVLQTSVNALLPSPVTLPAPTNANRLVAEVKREFFAAKYGRRDAQWSMKRAISQARELVYIEAPNFEVTSRGPAADYKWDLVATLVDRMNAQKDLRVILCLPRQVPFGKQYASWAKQQTDARKHAITLLDATRVLAFHPVGFPGRFLNLRTSVTIVDDVWCLLGTSVPRRRGFTFDGGTDLASCDLQRQDGYSVAVRNFRRTLMSMHLGDSAPAPGSTPTTTWVRLGQPRAAFAAVKELLDQGGRGLIAPLWDGAPDVVAQSDDVADPEGREVSAVLTFLVAGLADLETAPA